jgi:hypothetical protein
MKTLRAVSSPLHEAGQVTTSYWLLDFERATRSGLWLFEILFFKAGGPK